jgi:hypothetical protein
LGIRVGHAHIEWRKARNNSMTLDYIGEEMRSKMKKQIFSIVKDLRILYAGGKKPVDVGRLKYKRKGRMNELVSKGI